jgi:hypothetical protein
MPEQVGIWDLEGSEVRVRVQGVEGKGVELYQPPKGTSTWPMAPRTVDELGSWRDLRFVPSMQALTGDGRIDPGLVGDVDSVPGSLPSRVASRIHLDLGRFEGGIPSQSGFRENFFDFAASDGASRLRQALTDTLRWSVEADAPVVVEIIPAAGGRVKRLVFAPGAGPHEIFISNLPADTIRGEAHHAVSEEEMTALHFGAYYALLQNPPAERPLPRRVPITPARRAAGLSGSILCPPGNFSY